MRALTCYGVVETSSLPRTLAVSVVFVAFSSLPCLRLHFMPGRSTQPLRCGFFFWNDLYHKFLLF
jgi:hypothetical protein